MALANLSDVWWRHPKVVAVTLAARGLYASALSWGAAYDCDDVPIGFLDALGADLDLANELVAVGLWKFNGNGFDIIPWQAIEPQKRRPAIPRRIRDLVYLRDGYRCVTCGTGRDLTLDHVRAYSKGGPDTIENLQTMCRPCNSRKGDA